MGFWDDFGVKAKIFGGKVHPRFEASLVQI